MVIRGVGGDALAYSAEAVHGDEWHGNVSVSSIYSIAGISDCAIRAPKRMTDEAALFRMCSDMYAPNLNLLQHYAPSNKIYIRGRLSPRYPLAATLKLSRTP